jgi:hypothetical protein
MWKLGDRKEFIVEWDSDLSTLCTAASEKPVNSTPADTVGLDNLEKALNPISILHDLEIFVM